MAFGIDASQVLGATQLAGVKVNPRGGVEGGNRAAGVALGGMNAGPRLADAAQTLVHGTPDGLGLMETPDFRTAWLAVTDSELALVRLVPGIARMKLREVIARTPRKRVTAAELGDELMPSITIGFSDNTRWRLETPRPGKEHARKVVELLQEDTSGAP